jgi:predicted N-formylglutamate amidohydrolase
MKLLAADEPAPFAVEQEHGGSPFLITCDHAGRRLPRRLGNLGLPDVELLRHIAWDIGAGEVARQLGQALDAFAIQQIYSRLAIDSNRDPSVESSIVTVSEATEIPGNRGLSDAERQARAREIFWPYHERIAAELDHRGRAKRATAVIAVHSFTPVFKGIARPWHAGVLYNRDPRLALILKRLLEGEGGLIIGDNEPYAVGDLTDYTIPVHGERRGLPHVEIEIRQDLIAEAGGQRIWAERLARLLPEAYRRLNQAAA